MVHGEEQQVKGGAPGMTVIEAVGEISDAGCEIRVAG